MLSSLIGLSLRNKFIVMLLTLPWSLTGAVVGHELLGFDLSVFSVFGMIALCGMVVNGAFVMAVTRNRYLQRGDPPDQVTRLAAMRRLWMTKTRPSWTSSRGLVRFGGTSRATTSVRRSRSPARAAS